VVLSLPARKLYLLSRVFKGYFIFNKLFVRHKLKKCKEMLYMRMHKISSGTKDLLNKRVYLPFYDIDSQLALFIIFF